MDRPQPERESEAERESGAEAPRPPEQQPQGAAAGPAQAPPAQPEPPAGTAGPVDPERPRDVAGSVHSERPPDAAGPEQPYGAAGSVPPAAATRRRVRLPGTVKTWVAAVIGAVLLLGGGIGGYFIGAANDHGRARPGVERYRDYLPGPPGDRGPWLRPERPNR